ncbi:hypothetical protein [Rodentibacter caecimuris]|uniref:hypothetical protein n=1 Tax=Rodentibacter caecimuris TaxID=1796644 RepID=UPI002119C21A|nr:hypothetical protein [Rodentibacter heylii]MCQ9123296.1 hypothetical protein [Rodentibacter heylii]
MKPANTAKALLLSLGIALNGQANLINHISESVEVISTKVQTANANDVFNEVLELAQSLQKLNLSIQQRIKKITNAERSSLLLVNNALNYGIGLLKTKFEDEIYHQFFNEFRALSAAKNALEINLRQIQERIDGVEIVTLRNLSLTQEELSEAEQWKA